MTDQKEIVFKIKDGNLSVETNNFKGVGCAAIQKAFADNGAVTQEVIKNEYYECAPTHVEIHDKA